MNAEAYLRKQGWQGAGHSLDGEGRGIAKPLLIAHKQDQLGLGKKTGGPHDRRPVVDARV